MPLIFVPFIEVIVKLDNFSDNTNAEEYNDYISGP
jgi:hypothetical protein